MPSSIEVHTQCRRHGRSSRPGRSVPTVRYTLMAPPSRLSVEQAAQLLRLPHRFLRDEVEWLAPGASTILSSRTPGSWEARA